MGKKVSIFHHIVIVIAVFVVNWPIPVLQYRYLIWRSLFCMIVSIE